MTDDALREEHRQYLMAPWQWRPLLRRVQDIPKVLKYILLAAADYANADGTGIRPGVPLLAAISDSSYEQVQAALKLGRELGLLFVGQRGNRRAGRADEYWLIVHPEVMDRCTVEDPTGTKVRAENIRKARACRAVKSRTRADNDVSDGPMGHLMDADDEAIRRPDGPPDGDPLDGPGDHLNPALDGPPDHLNGLLDGLGDPPTTTERADLPLREATPSADIDLSRPLTHRAPEAAAKTIDLDEVALAELTAARRQAAADLSTTRCTRHGLPNRAADGHPPRCSLCKHDPEPHPAALVGAGP